MEENQMEVPRESRNKVGALVILLFIVGAIALGVLYIRDWNFGKETKDVYATLESSNNHFTLANSLAAEGKLREAAEEYKLALPEADSAREEGFILLNLATVTSDPIEAIKLYKSVAGNASLPDIQKAYAVQYLGALLLYFPDANVGREIFSTQPYSDFFVQNDRALSQRRLFEYASSLSPLPFAELRIAHWYATEIVRLKQLKQPTQKDLDTVAEYLDIVKSKLQSAEGSLIRAKEAPVMGGFYVPMEVALKATIMGMLYAVGEKSLGDPEPVFDEAIKISKGSGVDATARLNYAIFLAQTYGMERKTDIVRLIEVFYTKRAEYPVMLQYLRSSNTASIVSKDSLLLLAGIDHNFKALLKELGWKL